MNEHPLNDLKEVAIRSAQAAGDILIDRYRQDHHIDGASPYDIKLRVDRLCEEVILDTILEAFPDHGIITEEGDAIKTSSGYIWIVDPLDGTVNYYHGISHFSSCVACYYQNDHGHANNRISDLSMLGIPLVGAVFSPVIDEFFLGVAGQGATCNGRSIHVRRETKLDESVISISYGSDENTMKKMVRLSSKLIRGVRKVRIFGSTSMDMAHVACGRISGLIQGCVRNWDFAAARVILEESGGIFNAKNSGDNIWEIIASSAGIYNPLKQLVNDTL
jgi:fructose-1,6-bisphosphatase/inositol monophosphatase family enzyme